MNRLYRLMNNHKKLGVASKILTLTIVFVLLITSMPTKVFAGEFTNDLYLQYNDQIYKYRNRLVTLEINNNILQTGDMPAILIGKTTMVPVREVFESESLGAIVDWNSGKQQVYINYLDKFIVLEIGSTTAFVNNKPVELEVPAMLIQDINKGYAKTMIPLRFVSENLGFIVDWDADSYTAEIYTDADSKSPDKNTSGTDSEETGSESSGSNESGTESDGDNSSVDGKDTTTDATIIVNEQLDKLEGTSANRTLPTALATTPKVLKAKEEIDVSEAIKSSYSESNILEEKHEKVYIDDIDYIESDEGLGFEIETTGPMSYVDTHVWDGKFIIQIYNAELELNNHTFEYDDHPFLTAIRLADHTDEETGQDYVKIVFDLKTAGYKFNLHLDDERDTLYVDAVNNSIYEVELNQNEIGDFIDITGVNATNVNTFRLSNPTRIVFDMPNTKTLLGYQEATVDGQYVRAIRTAQFEATTTRIVVETDGQPDYQIIEVDATTTRIQILEPTYENLSYDNTKENPTIVIDEDDLMIVDGVTYEDNYLNHEFIITIPGDYTSHFGSGDFKINDNIIEKMTVMLNEEGNTELQIESNELRVFRIEDSEEGKVIKAYRPSEIYDKVIVVDAGHGGKDPGAVVGNILEKDIVLSVTNELKSLLDVRTDIKVYYTRTEDVYPTLEERCVLANEVDADFFLSLHCNSFISSYTGTETLFLPGTDTLGLNSFELAEIFQTTFTDNTAIDSYKMKERDNLYVLKYTDMPAIILEMGYLTNSYDREYLNDYNYHDDLATAILMSIDETFIQHSTGR